jgi:hypothetical protein
MVTFCSLWSAAPCPQESDQVEGKCLLIALIAV